ncbi:MAG: PP2C family protein-serine/threonine phosphatase [Planctomycetota bacterium]|nr:PP2C family protein-serine/threonine phosphatase [Planctomycetota bacterium]
MNLCQVIVVLDDSADAGSWPSAILSAWPRTTPRPHLTTLDLNAALAHARSGDDADAVWLLIDRGCADGRTWRTLLATLASRLSPGVVVSARSDVTFGMAEQGWVSVSGDEVTSGAIAPILAALHVRQAVLADVRAEHAALEQATAQMRRWADAVNDELQLASRVQRHFLPREMPATRSLALDVLYRPCGYVSGDVYDVRRLDERRIGIFLADAVGHGVPAALLTMALTRALVTRERRAGVSVIFEPTEVLARLNRVLCSHEDEAHRMATAVYAIMDLATHEVTIAGAGHPPPLLVSQDAMTRIETDGPILGVFEEAEFTQVSVSMNVGDSLVIYTDGLESAFPEPNAEAKHLSIPTQNHLSHLRKLAGDEFRVRSDGRVLSDLAAIIDHQSGSLHQYDDVTVLAMCVVAAPAVEACVVSEAA